MNNYLKLIKRYVIIPKICLVHCKPCNNATKLNNPSFEQQNNIGSDWLALGNDLRATFKKIEELHGKRKKPSK